MRTCSATRGQSSYWLCAVLLALGLVFSEGLMGVGAAHAGPVPSPALQSRPEVRETRPVHLNPVSDMPVSWTPRVLDGKISDITQVGDTMIAGGSFSEVAPSAGSPVLNRSNVFAFSALNGAINTSFAPSISGGIVNAVEPGPAPGTVFVGGNFQGVNGVTGKVVLLDVATGQLVPGFTPPSMNGAVNDLQLIGNRLYVGGYFKRVASNDHGGLVALNATTGAREPFLQVDLTENHNYTGDPWQSRAGVGAKSMAVTPQGDFMAVVGNFRKANGIERRQMVMLDLTGPSATIREDWKTNRLAPSCFSHAFDTYVRDINVSPDGAYFVLATTGGPNPGTLCDTLTRWDVEAEGQDVQPVWFDETGGDTLLSAASSGAAVYTGGHQRWMNNLNGLDFPAAGAVPRPGIGAVDVDNGVPISWNPGRNPRGVGAEALYVSESGLWVGSDTEWIGNRTHRRPRLAYFPVAGGKELGAGDTGNLPANVYIQGTAPAIDAGVALYRVNSGGPSIAALDNGPNWMGDTGAESPFRNSGSSTATYGSAGLTVDGRVPPSAPSEVFNSERYNSASNNMQWMFPVPTGENVLVRLYFANRYDGTGAPGQRVFDIKIEGNEVLNSYDISADVGHNVGTIKEFTAVSDGTLNIEWIPRVENPLINAIEILEIDSSEPEAAPTGLGRLWFTGEPLTDPITPVPSGNIEWPQVRGAVVIDGVLHYGTSSGEFLRRTFDGEIYGDVEVIDPYNDPFWSDISTGSGGHNYRGVKPSFYSQIPSLTGMAYHDGRLYYTRAGSNRLFSRGFSPDSGTITQTAREAPVFSSAALGEIFFDTEGETLFFANASSGELSSIDWKAGAPSGASTVVSGPTIDGIDWRGRAVFIADGPAPIVNEPPTATFEVECDRLECLFNGTGSFDPDGEISSFEWNFGDDSEPSMGPSVTHVFDQPGTYTVTLRVTDDEGAVGSISVDHEVRSNNEPIAVISDPVCNELECVFDGSGSYDPDSGDSVATYEWNFGDGSEPASGSTAAHVFSEPGTYEVTLVVTDTDGASGRTSTNVDLNDPVGLVPELVGSSAALSEWGTSPAVGVPAGVEPGDLLVLFASSSENDVYPVPVGWNVERRTVSGPLAVSVFTRVADESDAGGQVSLALPYSIRTDLTMVAYRGVHEGSLEALESVIDSKSDAHYSPQVVVGGESRVVLTFWADRSSSTTEWGAPEGVEVLSTQVGSGGGHLGTLLVGAAPGEGGYGPLAATTNAPSGRGVSMMVVLAPTESSEPPAPEQGMMSSGVDEPDFAGEITDGTDAPSQLPATQNESEEVEVQVDGEEGQDAVQEESLPELVGITETAFEAESASVTFPEDIEPGDLLLLYVAANQSEVHEVPAGWTAVESASSDEVSFGVFAKEADGSESSSDMPISLTEEAAGEATILVFRGARFDDLRAAEPSIFSGAGSYISPSLNGGTEHSIGLNYWYSFADTDFSWSSPSKGERVVSEMAEERNHMQTLVVIEEFESSSYGEISVSRNADGGAGVAVTLLLPSGDSR